MNLTILLELRKAFNTVDHNILIKKLNSYGIVDRTGGWLNLIYQTEPSSVF